MSTKLTLTGSVEWEKEIDDFTAAKVIALVVHDGDIQPSPPGATPPQTDLLTPMSKSGLRFAGKSLMEAFEETQAKVKPQQLVVAGYRSMEEAGTDYFTSRQVIEQFKSVGISTKNLDREIRKAISAGFIYAATGDRGKYRVTERAMKSFSEGFSGVQPVVTKSGTKKRSVRLGSTTKLEVSDAVKALPIRVTLDGYPNYHSLNVKGDRILWILILASQNGVAGLNSKEIEYIARELRDQISSSAVPALTETGSKKGYLARNNSLYRLLHAGDIFIKDK